MSYDSAVVLNGYLIPAAIRHEVIFQVLDALPVHHSVTLVNDHDPKPLFYQLDAEQPGRYSHESVEPPDPDSWAVKITRNATANDIPLA